MLFHNGYAALGVVAQDGFRQGLMLAVEDVHLLGRRGDVQHAGPHVVGRRAFDDLPDMRLAAALVQDAVGLVVAGEKAVDVAAAQVQLLLLQALLELPHVFFGKLPAGQLDDSRLHGHPQKAEFRQLLRIDLRHEGPPLGQYVEKALLGQADKGLPHGSPADGQHRRQLLFRHSRPRHQMQIHDVIVQHAVGVFPHVFPRLFFQ